MVSNFNRIKVDLQLQWIIADDWVYRQLLSILQNLKEKSRAIEILRKLAKIPKIKAFAAESFNFNLAMEISDPEAKSEVLTILCESESIAQLLDQRQQSDPYSLEGMLSSWLTGRVDA